MPTQSCIIYQNAAGTVTLIDIPRSIEVAQGCLDSMQLIASEPLEQPFPSIEPRSQKARQNLGDGKVQELLLHRFLDLALEEVRAGYVGDWCLDRVTGRQITDSAGGNSVGKRRREIDEIDLEGKPDDLKQKSPTTTPAATSLLEMEISECFHLEDGPEGSIFYHNDQPTVVAAKISTSTFYIPPNSTILRQCDISSPRGTLPLSAPQFNLMLLDPPWPNRSARRKKSYGIAYNSASISSLLRSVPVESNLLDGGLIGVWITNRSSFREMVLREGGLFEQWNVKHVEEWVWLKVTKSGELICSLDSAWKKPYEILLVGKKGMEASQDVTRKVIAGVPDIHSRKPNFKGMFERMMGRGPGEYEALEVFARNLTAGWWSWGNEVLKFQSQEHWVKRH